LKKIPVAETLNTEMDEHLRYEKHQSRFTSIAAKILWLHAQGMSTRHIVNAFDEWCAEISPTLISRITNAFIGQVVEWQSRLLGAIYPIVYLFCIVVKIRQDKHI
jgi:putative transposase